MSLTLVLIILVQLAVHDRGNDGILIEASASANMNVTVQNSFFTSSQGDLFQFNAPGTGTSDLVFTGNALSNNYVRISTGGGGVSIGSGSTSNVTLNISNNTFRDAVGHAVLVVKDVGIGNITGTFSTNTIGVAGIGNSGSLEGAGLKVQHAGSGSTVPNTSTSRLQMNITNNQIRQYNNEGILIQAGAGIAYSGNIIATLSGNTLANPGTNAAISNIFQGLN